MRTAASAVRERRRQGQHRADARPRRSTIACRALEVDNADAGDALLRREDAARLPPRRRRQGRGDARAHQGAARRARHARTAVRREHRQRRPDARTGSEGSRRPARRLQARARRRRERQGHADDQQHRLPAVHDLRDQRDGARRVLEAVPAARRIPKNVPVLQADARSAPGAGDEPRLSRPGPTTSPATR